MSHKIGSRTLFFLSWIIFLTWWGLYANTPLQFPGKDIQGAIAVDSTAALEQYKQTAIFASGFPDGLRPLTSWMVLSAYYLVTGPVIALAAQSGTFFKTRYPVAVATNLVSTLAALFAFGSLAAAFSWPYAVLILGGLALIPFSVPICGLVEYDLILLLFWAIVLHTLAKHPPISRWDMIAAVLAGLLGSWIMENTGLALALALGFRALIGTRGERVYARLGMGAALGTVIALVISGLMLRHHRGAFDMLLKGAAAQGAASFTGWTLFGWLVKMGRLPALAGIVSLTISLFSKVQTEVVEKNRQMLYSGAACLVGFLLTLPMQWWACDMAQEWTRQLLPYAYLLLGLAVSSGLVAGTAIRERLHILQPK